MKILYVANDRRAAQMAANALRDIAQNVTLASAESLTAAERWLYSNRDVAALIVEAEVQNQSCASLVRHVRNLALAAPVVVVTPDHVGAPLAAIKAGADDYVADNESLLAVLPGVVGRAMQRKQAVLGAGAGPARPLYR